MKSKEIVVYFSHIGENYINGKITNISIGNTKIVAEKIQKLLNCDIFEIKTIKNYPVSYDETVELAKKELNSGFRPELKEDFDLSEYETIYVGYPNWWGTMPTAVFGFLENKDLSGKIIKPFCTHEGSGMGHSESDLKDTCKSSIVKKGLALYGSKVKEADRLIENWIKN